MERRGHISTNPENSREKIFKEKTIFHDSKAKPFTWKDIKHIEFHDDDELHIRYEEPHYTEDNSYDGYFAAEVVRNIIETDEEYEERMNHLDSEQRWAKERRYKSYLKLKEEFTPIFTTYDGVEIFKGDKYFTLESKVPPLFIIAGPFTKPENVEYTNDLLYFSTWKAASNFVNSVTVMNEVEDLLKKRIED